MHKFWLLLVLPFMLIGKEVEKPFVILIPSYNNEKFCELNLLSALRQKYTNYRVIYVNDCSSDRTLANVKQILAKENSSVPVTLVDNKERHKALYNLYHAIHDLIEDDEIVLTLDGDDALSSSSVLRYLNKVYSNPEREIWLTYGQFKQYKSGHRGWCVPIPDEIVQENAFRKFAHIPSHLRTFYAWLFKRIKLEDLMLDGEFMPMTWDMAMMLPMIEMARDHFAFIPTVLYIYNDSNPISDHMVDVALQRQIDQYVRSLPSYEPL
jgi:glycosyltransferase involved in cell wall biosynthesis